MKFSVDKDGILIHQDTFKSDEEIKEILETGERLKNPSTDSLYEPSISIGRCATVKRGLMHFVRSITSTLAGLSVICPLVLIPNFAESS